jgi:hypothetical protein
MSENQDAIIRKIDRRKKSRRRTRGPYRKSSSAGMSAIESRS